MWYCCKCRQNWLYIVLISLLLLIYNSFSSSCLLAVAFFKLWCLAKLGYLPMSMLRTKTVSWSEFTLKLIEASLAIYSFFFIAFFLGGLEIERKYTDEKRNEKERRKGHGKDEGQMNEDNYNIPYTFLPPPSHHLSFTHLHLSHRPSLTIIFLLSFPIQWK